MAMATCLFILPLLTSLASAQYRDNSAWSPATQHNSHGWSAQNCSAYYTTTSPSPLSHVCQNWNSQASNPFEKFFGPIPGVVRPEFRVPCNVKDPLACNASLFEVCTFNQGAYGCTCPPNFSRLPDGRCKVANECYEPSMNDCSHNAICIDEIESYRCQCKPGFTDVSPDPSRMPGRVCLQVEDQCSHPAHYNIDCDKHATCQNTPHGFTCVCNPGYVDTSELVNLKPGRRCSKEVNECANPSMNDCSPNATCIDTKEGYTCRCKPGYIDVSMNVGCYPGRECRLPTETSASERQCDPRDSKSCPNGEICEFSGGLYRCTCPNNAARLENGQCATAKNCQTEKVDCDPNADCINLVNGYTCQCNSGFRDVSPDPVKKPGRKCSQLINECAIPWMNKCSPFAECIDTPESYLCQCKHGYVDVSSTYGLPPGRQCSNTTKMCARPETNSCDPEAVCIDKPDGYICVCPEGYVDVSSNAKLQPGRVCTLQTLCPTQPTDLVFLIDGSGSIGTEIFYKYVMRFVHEFVTLFDINEDRTRVGIIQYTGQVKPEFYLNQHKNIDQLQQAIRNIRYVGGLTKTGAALQFMTKNTFTAQMGARTRDPNVYKIGVVITDGRAQDNVKIPADEARRHNISLYAVGVTNHVLESELEQIAGSKDRYFIVGTFAELNTRLRAKIQKEMCKESDVASLPPSRSCAVPENEVQNPCDRTLNQVCIQGKCGCGYGFCKNLKTGECGFSSCNPELPTSCPFPTVCKKTIYGDARCACPDDHICHPSENTCVKVSHSYQCSANEDYNYATGKCEPKGSFCKPICDPRKKEVCLRNRYDPSKMSCQCPEKHLRDPNTGICTVDECAHQLHDCSPHATCTDTFDSYICSCLPGYIDKSRDPIREPGRICEKPLNPCESGRHNCSPDALCFPTATGGFTCQCRDGYLDMSPNLKQSPGLVCKKKVNECADPSLNNCSENAECTDTDTGYLCHCKPGYRDISPLQSPGRKCVPDVCQSPDKNDCWQGRCRTTDAESGQYTCEPCPSGYMDKSPNPNLPGRLCVPKKSPCSDPSRNDCSHYAWCLEVGEENYSCKCRDGFDDVSPNPSQYPGRVCEPATDPCRDNRMNDCDPHALCEKSGRSYTCTCKTGYLDTSPDKARAPGRQCTQLVNECENFQMNNCSRYAKCIDKEIGYTCECLEGYHDTNPQSPGRECSLVINECESYNLNDCHPNAICTDLLVGYSCKCKPPYVDHSPDPQKPGRICKYNECSDPNLNDCDPNAECQDTESSYVCFCKEGYKDMDPSRPGRNCLQISTPPPVTTEAPCDIQCGTKLCCSNRGEVCLRGQCSCPPGFGRANSYDNCRPVDTVTIPVIVNRLGESPLVWSSTFSDSDHPRFVEISDLFSKGVGEALSSTDVEPAYINTQVLEIKNAHHINSKLPEGLLVDASIQMQRGGPPAEVVCRQLQASIKNAGDIIGKTQLHTPESFDICRPIIPKQMPPSCGGLTCKEDLGEVCIGEQICACPYGKGRHDPHDHCQDVVAINLPLLIKRKGHQTLQFNNAYGDTSSPEYQNIVNTFTDGIKRAFARTAIYPQYTGNEVRDIRDPRTMNSTWNDGLWFEFTTYFLKGYEPSPSEAYNHLLGSILETHYSVGGTDLYINEYQPPFACYQHTCDSRSIIIDRGDGVCACKCPEGYVDRNVVHPGTKCVPMIVTTPRITTPFPNCGDNYCYSSLGEICHNGECVCPPGMSRRLEGQPCIQVDTFTIPIVVDRWASMPLQWSTVYEHPDDSRFIEMHNVYLTAVGQAVKSLPETDSSTVSFSVDQINDPSKTYPNVGSGLLFNTTFAVSPGATDKEKFCNTFMKGIKESGYKIGSSQLHVDENVDPCKPPPKAKSELPCGNLVCKSSLGEVCIGNRLCACPFGFGRKHENDPCIETIPISLPLWVIRRNQDPLYFGKNYSDSNSPLRKEVVDMFETGVKRAYDRTPLNNNFLDVAVRDISNPSSVNSTFGKGLWFDFIVHFTPAPSLTAQEAHTQLLDSIRGTAYSIGGTELYINEWQPSIACYKNDCFKGGICIPLADGGYTCKCPENYEDKQPRNPGRQCSILVNPCSDPALNNCDPNAECVFLSNGQYRCECKAGFSEPHGFIGMKGTNCVYDLCVDLPFCKEKNATCVNYGDRADCQCLDGYLDIRKSPINVRAQFGLDDVFCLKPQDVDRCALGLHNCIPPAVCIGGRGDSPQCRCPDGTMIYEGVLCQEKLDSCAECNYHGDCVFKDNQTYCQCHDWYTGEKCTTDVRIILVIIFAIIFFLLTLLCCLYFCLKCHFIRNRGLVYREMGGSSGSEGLSAGYGRESDFYTDFSIPRAKLKDHPMKGYAAEASPDRRMMQYLDSAGQHAGDEQLGSETIAFSDVLQGIPRRGAGYRDDMSESEYSSGSYQEEIQRRVTKDTKRTITTKTIHGAGNTKAVFNVYPPENIEEGKASESQAAMKTFSSQKCITNAFDDEQDFSSTEYDEGESETSSQCVLGETFDTKTSAKQTHQVVPDADGYGGVERFISQTSTTTKSKHTQQH